MSGCLGRLGDHIVVVLVASICQPRLLPLNSSISENQTANFEGDSDILVVFKLS